MRIIKAYTDAIAMGNMGFGMGTPQEDAREQSQSSNQVKSSGDKVRLSREAMKALETGGESLSVCAQDATYDQKGNITRQVDALRRDLNSLSLFSYPAGAGMAAKINSLRSQVNTLSTSV